MMHIQNVNELFAHMADPGKVATIKTPADVSVLRGFSSFNDQQNNAVGIRGGLYNEISFADKNIVIGTGCDIMLVSDNGNTVKVVSTYNLFPGRDVVLITEDNKVVGIAPLFIKKKEYKEYMTFIDGLKLDNVGWMFKVVAMVRLTEFLFNNRPEDY